MVSSYIIIRTEASPSQLLLSNVKLVFNNYVESELKIQHIAAHHISRALNGLDSLFTFLMLPSNLSEKHLHNLALFFNNIHRLTPFQGFSMAEYLHITPRAPDNGFRGKFAVDILLHSDLNIFELGTFMESGSRQLQIARVIRLLSKSGLTRYELCSLIDRLDALDSQTEVENLVDLIEYKMERLFLTSFPTSILFPNLSQLVGFSKEKFDELSKELTLSRWFSSIFVPWIGGTGEPLTHITDSYDKKSIISQLTRRILRGITSEARIGLVPRLLYLVFHAASYAHPSRLAFAVAVVDVAVRLSSSPVALDNKSLVPLAKSIDDINPALFMEVFFPREEYEEKIFDFSLSIESNYGIKVLSEYPQLFPLWSKGKADFMQRILQALSWFDFQRLECTQELLQLTDDQIIVAAKVLHDIASREASQFENMILFNPYFWLCKFVKNPSSRFVQWLIQIQRPSILSSKITSFSGTAPLPLDIQRSINEFFGFPFRFMEMGRRISRLRIQCASSIIASLKRICMESLELPGSLLYKEVDWGILYGAGNQRTRCLIEEGLLRYFDLLDVFLKANDAVSHQNIAALLKCREKLTHFASVKIFSDPDQFDFLQSAIKDSEKLEQLIRESL